MSFEHAPAPGRSRRSLVQRAMHLWFRFARPMTLGVRVALLHPVHGVFLVRHTYVGGWHMPGGGIEPGETALQAAAREVSEECNIVMRGEPQLRGFHFNVTASDRDHVALYVCRDFDQTSPRGPDREIAEARYFPLDGLPRDLSRATRDRLAEILEDRASSPYW